MPNTLIDTLTKMQSNIEDFFILSKAYSESFPAEIKQGLLSFRDNTKELKTNYIKFSASLSCFLTNMEQTVSGIPSIMRDADKALDEKTILLCNDILLKYEGLCSDIDLFMSKSECALKSNNIPSSALYSYLTELERKVKSFENYIKIYK